MKRCNDCKWLDKMFSFLWLCGKRLSCRADTCDYYSRKWWKLWAPTVLLITLALLTMPDGTEFLMDGQKSELPKVEITATNITIGGKAVKP